MRVPSQQVATPLQSRSDSGPPVANCFGVESFDWTVTVTATSPAGVLHEFFFDPVAIGSSAGADATNGVLKPAIFTNANGASTTIESITYEAGRVKVKVVPWTAMRQHTLDIINQDGTLLAPLTLQNSAVETHTNTLIWKVTPQPWMDGDKLMGHIRSAAPFASSPNGGVCHGSEGEDSIRLAWNSASGGDMAMWFNVVRARKIVGRPWTPA